MKEGTKNKQC